MQLQSVSPKHEATGPRHPILVRILTVGIGITIGLVLFEIGLHIAYRDSPHTSQPSTAMSESRKEAVSLRPASRWAFMPTLWSQRFEQRTLNMRFLLVPFSTTGCDSQVKAGSKPNCDIGRQNSHGFRLPEYTIARPPNTFRIVIVGDSFTWGDGIDVQETYHQRLQERFDRTRSAGAPRIEVIALGINGSTIWDNVIRLLVYGERLQPDLVLVQFYNNDLEYRGHSGLFRYEMQEDDLDFFLNATAIGRVLSRRIRDRHRGSLWHAEMQRQYESGSLEWGLFQAVLDTLVRWRRDRDVPVAFLSFPVVDRSPGNQNFQHFQSLPSVHQFTGKAEREIEQHGFPLLRLLETFRARAGDRYLAVSPTNGHYGPLANELVADALVNFLRESDWIDLGTPRQRPGDDRWAAEHAIRLKAEERWSDYHQSYDLQLELFKQLVALFPKDPWLTQSLAFIHQEQGNVERARALYHRLVELDPQHAAPWYRLSLLTADPTEQEKLLVRMLNAVPDHANAIEHLANLDAGLGRLRRACGCYRRLTELSNNPEQYRRAVGAIRQHTCDQITESSCPGPDPLQPFRPSRRQSAQGVSEPDRDRAYPL